ncbi:uncharacterized protein [Danio rerio]|uniref:Ig-like domain-containing protein n=1 Tax=Danio rerio TaxID=7955 RepID=A0A8M2BCN3_DANRE
MDITWYSETSVVCAYKNREVTQGVGYEGRANLFIHDLVRGNVSLRVANFTESDLGVYMCQVTSQNKTQQITVNVTEEESAIFKDQHLFTVDYKMRETNKELCQHESDKHLPEKGEGSYKISIKSYHSASDKNQHGGDKGETSKELSSKILRSKSLPAYKMSEDNMNGPEKRKLSSQVYSRSLHGDFKMALSKSRNFQLVVPSTAEAEVSLGSDLVIPCQLSPEINAVDMEISWSKDADCVCLYKDRKIAEGVWFKDRASLFFTHKLKKGDVSLRLKNFRLSDIGNYHCQVINGDRREEITVRVRVNPGIQPVNQSPIYQDKNAPSILREDEKIIKATNKSPRHPSHHSDSYQRQHVSFNERISSNDFQLVIPQTTEEAKVSLGSELTVPCYSSPEICATAMQIRWFKETDCVCVYKNKHMNEGRGYKDRVSLDSRELERGNVSVLLRNFSVSDVGDYHCQVSSGGRTQHITVGVRIKPEVQPVSQAPTPQDQCVQLMLSEADKIWTEEETSKMDEFALMAEMNVNNEQELYRQLIKAYNERN